MNKTDKIISKIICIHMAISECETKFVSTMYPSFPLVKMYGLQASRSIINCMDEQMENAVVIQNV